MVQTSTGRRLRGSHCPEWRCAYRQQTPSETTMGAALQKNADMHQLPRKIFSTRAYEEPCWHSESQKIFPTSDACPKSFAML